MPQGSSAVRPTNGLYLYLLLRERPGTHFTGGWVGLRAIWTGAENLAATGIRSPDRPARRQSLYRLSYRVHQYEEMK